MSVPITAIYEGGVLRPTAPLGLAEGSRVAITIEPAPVENPRGQEMPALVQSMLDAKGLDELPEDYDFLEALNANRGLNQRPIYPPDEKGISW